MAAVPGWLGEWLGPGGEGAGAPWGAWLCSPLPEPLGRLSWQGGSVGLGVPPGAAGTPGYPAGSPCLPRRRSPSDRLSQAERHQHRLQRLHRGQQGEPGGQPLPGGRAGGAGSAPPWGTGLLLLRPFVCWEHQAGAPGAPLHARDLQTQPWVLWLGSSSELSWKGGGYSGRREMEKDPPFQGSQRISSFLSTTGDSDGSSVGAEGW